MIPEIHSITDDSGRTYGPRPGRFIDPAAALFQKMQSYILGQNPTLNTPYIIATVTAVNSGAGTVLTKRCGDVASNGMPIQYDISMTAPVVNQRVLIQNLKSGFIVSHILR